jgi:hypothetical protein
MLRERYAPMNRFDLSAGLEPGGGAGVELTGSRLDDDALLQAVKADLAPAFRGPCLTDARSPQSRSSCGCWWSSTCIIRKGKPGRPTEFCG